VSTARALAWAKLLRLSNAPTIPADLLAGFCAGRAFGGAEPFLALPAAGALVACLGIYHGALVLNDRVDFAHDRATRPDRPLPSGMVSRAAANGAILSLALLALIGALLAPPRVQPLLAPLALCAAGYDVALKRSALLGPLALGICRALDLGIGLALAGAACTSGRAPLLLAAYGSYVVALSGLARMEDGVPRLSRIRTALLAAASCFALGPLAVAVSPACAVSAALGLWIATRGFVAPSTWTRERVGRTVGRLLGLLALFGALIAWSAERELAALAALALFAAARLLARVIPPT
jgi:4-hydroxybenzoate polyprenyltransferase